MKKILNLITISTLTAVIPTSCFNLSINDMLESKGVGITNSNNEYVPLKEISGFGKAVQEVLVDSKYNIYFCIKTIFDYKNGVYKLSSGSTSPIKIDNSYGVLSFSIDSKDNLYFSTDNGLYKLSTGSDIPTKINGVSDRILSTVIDNSNNLYFTNRFVVNKRTKSI